MPFWLHSLGAFLLAFGLLEIALRSLELCLGLRRQRRIVWIATLGALVFVLPDLLTGNPLTPTQVMDVPGLARGLDTPHSVLNDTYLQFIPWEAEVRRLFGQGHLPLWSDRLGGGFPIWSNPQAQCISPIALLTRFGPLEHFLLLGLALKIAIAFRGVFWLCRMLAATRFAAALGAASFAWGGGLLAWGLWPHGSTLAWIPWLLVSTILLVRRYTRKRMAATAVMTAVVLVSGYPVMAAFGGLLAAGCGLYFGFSKRKGRARGWPAAVLAASMGFGLAATHLLPFAATLATSHRSQEASSYLEGRLDRGFLPDELLRPSAHFNRPDRVGGILHPAASGWPYQEVDSTDGPLRLSAYSGLLALLGAAIALASRSRSALPFLTYALIALAINVGWLPLDPWNRVTPEWYFRLLFNFRFTPIMALCISVAGALGWSRLRATKAAWLALVVVAGMSLWIAAMPTVVLLWALLTAAIAWKGRPRLHQALLVAVLLIDLVPWSRSLLPQGDPTRFFPTTEPITLAQKLAEKGRWRVTGQGHEAYPNLLPVYGLADIRYHDPLEASEYRDVLKILGFHRGEAFSYFSPMMRTSHPVLDFLGVRAIFTRQAHQYPSDRFRIVAEDDKEGWRLLENERALTRFFLTTEASVVPASRVLEALEKQMNSRRVVLAIEEIGTSEWRLPRLSAPYFPLEATESRDGWIQLALPGRKARLLATSLKDPRGWRVESENGSLRKVTVNHAFLGAIVPEGVEAVRLEYRPPGFRVGAVLGLVSLAWLGWLLLAPQANAAAKRDD